LAKKPERFCDLVCCRLLGKLIEHDLQVSIEVELSRVRRVDLRKEALELEFGWLRAQCAEEDDLRSGTAAWGGRAEAWASAGILKRQLERIVVTRRSNVSWLHDCFGAQRLLQGSPSAAPERCDGESGRDLRARTRSFA
jgi:hypothetical protein